MRTYARVHEGRVVELVTIDSDISTMFHAALIWVDVSSVSGIAEGWTYDGSIFSKPVVPEIIRPALSIASIRAQLEVLAAQLVTLNNTA
jgi:hypothetical protein